MMRTAIFSSLSAAILFLSGCSKEPAVAAAHNPAPAQQVAAAEGAGADLAALTASLRRYGMERQKIPQSYEELIAAGYLKTLPPAPAGKRFAIDSKKLEAILINQ